MTRDIELLRRILRDMERWPNQFRYRVQPLTFDGVDDAVVDEHVRYLVEAGYVETDDGMRPGVPSGACVPNRITATGKDFLNTIRWAPVPAHGPTRVATQRGNRRPPGS